MLRSVRDCSGFAVDLTIDEEQIELLEEFGEFEMHTVSLLACICAIMDVLKEAEMVDVEASFYW